MLSVVCPILVYFSSVCCRVFGLSVSVLLVVGFGNYLTALSTVGFMSAFLSSQFLLLLALLNRLVYFFPVPFGFMVYLLFSCCLVQCISLRLLFVFTFTSTILWTSYQLLSFLMLGLRVSLSAVCCRGHSLFLLIFLLRRLKFLSCLSIRLHVSLSQQHQEKAAVLCFLLEVWAASPPIR